MASLRFCLTFAVLLQAVYLCVGQSEPTCDNAYRTSTAAECTKQATLTECYIRAKDKSFVPTLVRDAASYFIQYVTTVVHTELLAKSQKCNINLYQKIIDVRKNTPSPRTMTTKNFTTATTPRQCSQALDKTLIGTYAGKICDALNNHAKCSYRTTTDPRKEDVKEATETALEVQYKSHGIECDIDMSGGSRAASGVLQLLVLGIVALTLKSF